MTAPSDKPPAVNEAAVRLKGGLKKALIFGGIALAAVAGLGLWAAFFHPVATALGVGGTWLLGGSGALGTVAAGVFLGIPAVAAGLGFLLGATDERPVLQARAEGRRAWMEARMEAHEEERGLAMAARQSSLENQKHRQSLIGGGFSPTPFGGAGGGGQGPGRHA